MKKKLPGAYQAFRTEFPACGSAYDALAAASREAAGFAPREAELLKLALAIGARLEGSAHSHARRALDAGATPAEVRGVALLALTTLGFPQTMMGLAWVDDVVPKGKGRKGSK